MNYEEKYKEALERAKKEWSNNLDGAYKNYREHLEFIFPELTESEDERIRKTLIRFHKSTIDIDGIKGSEIISWLEKQGEKKSADNVEPKFKVGDWIASDIFNNAKIIGIEGDRYEIEFINGSKDFPHIDYIDRKFHLWTIDDAEDCDILSNGKMIVIFKKFEEPSYWQGIIAYIGLDTGGDIQITDGTWQLGFGQVRPATKEERDTLFAKMKEYGLEWDAEKKELKKIELHNSYKIEPKFKVGDKVTNGHFECEIERIDDTTYYCDIAQFDIKDQDEWELVETIKKALNAAGYAYNFKNGELSKIN